MRIHFVDKFSEGDAPRQVEAMRNAGFEYVSVAEAEIIYCASIFVMKRAMEAKQIKNVPLVVYCWDYYKWSHGTQNTSGDWVAYADFLRSASLILVPSRAQQKRLKELLNLDSHVVLSGVTTFDYPKADGRYVLEALRTYPEEQASWTKKACDELGISMIHTEHQLPPEEFKRAVANCSFMVCPVNEASTGGLTLAEGLWLGKPSLISDSPYQGGKEYVGKFASTFRAGDYEDFKAQLWSMWNFPTFVDLDKARQHISENLTYEKMAQQIFNLCQKYT